MPRLMGCIKAWQCACIYVSVSSIHPHYLHFGSSARRANSGTEQTPSFKPQDFLFLTTFSVTEQIMSKGSHCLEGNGQLWAARLRWPHVVEVLPYLANKSEKSGTVSKGWNKAADLVFKEAHMWKALTKSRRTRSEQGVLTILPLVKTLTCYIINTHTCTHARKHSWKCFKLNTACFQPNPTLPNYF